MSSTNFVDYSQNTPIVAAWLNDVNKTTYTTAGTPKTAIQSASAWVRFSVTGGVVSLQQSSNVSTVTRTGTGVYVIAYGTPMTNIVNCYSIAMSNAGFAFWTVDNTGSVTITCTNTSNTAFDPSNVSVIVFGAD